ncbi:MAG: dTDP-4-dehydrorhamnose 3,5-epimerase family protein [Alphaproteobacteria bacterium]|nr:dTDP-4-dehydrorhamnose 3,5-epimerase family protein [Alphaproteobacteria bacterium]MCD8566643.1 dTDP-4-dehydrorhamnose 3,5-epimerase family protein [Alphaproteobacteria bacterium]
MSRFDIHDTPLAGVKRITRKPMGDERGWLERGFCAEDLKPAGWVKPIAQINRTNTEMKGTLRGMHYQNPPHAEMKLVSCLHGKVLDIALDLRAGSPTFLQHFALELSENNHESLLIPEGVAHGFQSLTDNVEMLYLHSASYTPEAEDSVNPQDPRLGINWPLTVSVISERDKSKAFLSDDFKGITV